MGVDRLERVNSLLKRVIGEAMFRVMQHDEINPVMITVTNVACATNLRDATVSVSVFGPPEMKERALQHLVHHARDFQKTVNREVRLKFTPQLHFKLDNSLEKGDHVLAVLDSLDAGAQPAEDGGDAVNG